MSEAAKETTDAPKKKGKLPLIIVLALVLAGGGFFGMKSRSGGKKEPPPVKLGEIVEMEKEFLANLRGSDSYIRTDVAFHLKEGSKKEEFDKQLPAIRDAVVGILAEKSAQDVSTEKGKEEMKKEICESINKILEEAEAAHGKGEHDEKKKEEPKKEGHAKPKHPDWQSEEGPVLKVYFTSFATQ